MGAGSAGSMTDAGMQAFILRRLRASAVFLRPFEKLTRKLLKAALGLFGLAGDRSVHTQAILFIRQLALVLPQPALDDCLKVSALSSPLHASQRLFPVRKTTARPNQSNSNAFICAHHAWSMPAPPYPLSPSLGVGPAGRVKGPADHGGSWWLL